MSTDNTELEERIEQRQQREPLQHSPVQAKEQEPKTKVLDPSVLGTLDPTKSVPENYKFGRAMGVELANPDPNLFTAIEEKANGKFVIHGIERKVNAYQFYAFMFAMAKILYNQSYQSGNEDTNSGVRRVRANKVSEITKQDCYVGMVVVSLNDICRAAFGVADPTALQREEIERLIDILHENEVSVKYPNGDRYDAYLCTKQGVYTRAKDKAKIYELRLHTKFCEATAKNFALIPQNSIDRLAATTSRQTAAHLKLMLLLSMQDKRKPYKRYFIDLLNEMEMRDTHKRNPTRTEKQAISIFEDMKSIGLIKGYTLKYDTTKSRKRLDKVTFDLNQDYTK